MSVGQELGQSLAGWFWIEVYQTIADRWDGSGTGVWCGISQKRTRHFCFLIFQRHYLGLPQSMTASGPFACLPGSWFS